MGDNIPTLNDKATTMDRIHTIPVSVITSIKGSKPYVRFANEQSDVSVDDNLVAMYWDKMDCDGYGIVDVIYVYEHDVQRNIDYEYDNREGPIHYRILNEKELTEYYENERDIQESLRKGWDDDRY